MLKEIQCINITEKRNNLFKILFSNGYSCLLPKQFFVYFNPYRGKMVSKEEYIRIVDFARLRREINYAINLVKKRCYSLRELYEKLTKVKKLSFRDSKIIVDFLKEEYGIKENNTISTLIEEFNGRNLSNSMIEMKLIDKKFNYKLIKGLNKFDYQKEVDKGINVAKKYLNSRVNRNKEDDLSLNVYNLLSHKGFKFEIINDVLENVFDKIKAN